MGLSPVAWYRDDPLGLSPMLESPPLGSVILLRVLGLGGVFVSSVRRSWFVSLTCVARVYGRGEMGMALGRLAFVCLVYNSI